MNPFAVIFIPLLCFVVGYLLGEWKTLGDFMRTQGRIPDPPTVSFSDINWKDPK